jgi:hypothetical protein
MPISSRIVERIMEAQVNLLFDDTRAARERRRETIPHLYPAGSKLTINGGVFSGWLGEVIGATDNGQVVALIEFMGKMVTIELEPSEIEMKEAA